MGMERNRQVSHPYPYLLYTEGGMPMTITEITELTESGQKTTEEKLMLLKKIRANLMEELHCRQQVIDQVDYMIYELKTARKKDGTGGI